MQLINDINQRMMSRKISMAQMLELIDKYRECGVHQAVIDNVKGVNHATPLAADATASSSSLPVDTQTVGSASGKAHGKRKVGEF